jgi:hypothetical protein
MDDTCAVLIARAIDKRIKEERCNHIESWCICIVDDNGAAIRCGGVGKENDQAVFMRDSIASHFEKYIVSANTKVN